MRTLLFAFAQEVIKSKETKFVKDFSTTRVAYNLILKSGLQ
jgi:hypothetical protein